MLSSCPDGLTTLQQHDDATPPRSRLPDAQSAGGHPAAGVRRQEGARAPGSRTSRRPRSIERMRIAGRIAAQAMAEAGEHIAPGRHHRRARPGRRTSSCATTARTPRRSATGASPSRCAPRSTRSSATASPTPPCCATATSSTSTSPRSSDGVHGDTNATYLVGEVDEESRLLVERTREALDARHQGGRARAGSSTSSAGSSSRTPSGSATAWSATSPGTASARRSTPG